MTLPTPDDQPTHDQASLTIAEAAGQLGLSPQTVRRKIKAGSIPATLVDGPRGPEYRIPQDALTAEHPAQHASDQANHTTTQDYSGPARPLRLTVLQGSQAPDQASHGDEQATQKAPAGTSAALPEPGELLRIAWAKESTLLREKAELGKELEGTREVLHQVAGERDRQAEQIRFLQARLAAAAGEHAEEARELRVLLLRSQETTQALTDRLREAEQRALPAPRRPWWRLWG